MFAKKNREMKETDAVKAPHKKVLMYLFIFHVLLVLAYLGVSVFFMNHFFWNTTIDGADYSAKSIAASRKVLLNTTVEYDLAIQGKDGTKDAQRGYDRRATKSKRLSPKRSGRGKDRSCRTSGE